MTGELILPSYVRAPGGYRPAQRLRDAIRPPSSLTDLFGGQRNIRPPQPIFVYNASGKVQTILMPLGQTEVSELDDLIQEQQEQRPLDFDSWRERRGLPPREKAGALMAEAIERRIVQHRRNPISDPFRQPIYGDEHPNTVLPDRPWKKEQ